MSQKPTNHQPMLRAVPDLPPIDEQAPQEQALHEQAQQQEIALSERRFTFPTVVMTGGRLVLGAVLPYLMIRGRKGASIGAAIAAASDKESTAADMIDRRWPGWGRSEFGMRTDPIVDGIFGGGMVIGTLGSPNTSRSAKVAAAITAVKVGKQATWAYDANKRHLEAFGEPYAAKVEMVGKTGTASMLMATELGAITGDLDPKKKRQVAARRAAGQGAVAFATAGLVLGEVARRRHAKKLDAKLAAHAATKKMVA